MDPLIDNSKREFLLRSAVLCAGSVLGGSRTLFAQQPAAQGSGPYPTEGMAGYSATGPLKVLKFQRRALGPKDVAIRIDYCGVCHSDIHTIHGDWGKIQYPQIVGHELAGEVVAIGTGVSKFDVGSRVGVGTMVDSCRHCPECARGAENYCENGNTQTYGSKDRDGSITQGGYSKFIVVDEDFVLSIPASIDLAEAGPLLCAGVTTYSPLRHWGVAPGKKVAIAGLGGLGHLAVQFATKMGADVTVVTTSPDKVEDARRFGAKDVLINKDGVDFSKYKRAFDFILDTIPYQHDLDRFIPLLKRDATLCRVGVGKLTTPNQYGQMTTVLTRTALAGSNTGGIRETQDMLEFCAAQKIKPQITKIPMGGVNDAWSKVIAKQARYRFVMDMNMNG
ncbi:MAG: Alcohol dehydrogenase GroES domain protein [Bryobacterales bacterium]|nr:Alcohol dehydrogenase GroES domain protein [Bryobacterales bacterium]